MTLDDVQKIEEENGTMSDSGNTTYKGGNVDGD